MFWLGRFNAVFAIFSFVGLLFVWTVGGVEYALLWLFAMFIARVVFRVLDLVWTAFTGNPLFYDTKLLDRGDE